jgi:hypothetical protein
MNLSINVMYYVMFYVSVVANGDPNKILNSHTQGSQSADLRSDQFDHFDHNEYDYTDRRDLILDQRSHSETLYEYRPRATAVFPLTQLVILFPPPFYCDTISDQALPSSHRGVSQVKCICVYVYVRVCSCVCVNGDAGQE